MPLTESTKFIHSKCHETSARRKLVPKEKRYVIVTRDADFQELSLVWGQPPKVIRLRTFNQNRAATLKVLLENKAAIIESLVNLDLASIDLVL